eukprot:5379741-Amphidinium_carterae.1
MDHGKHVCREAAQEVAFQPSERVDEEPSGRVHEENEIQRRDTDAQVQVTYILEESFTSFGPHETDGVEHKGKTLCATLADIKRKKRLMQGKLSQVMRAHLKRVFAGPESAEGLKVKDK